MPSDDQLLTPDLDQKCLQHLRSLTGNPVPGERASVSLAAASNIRRHYAFRHCWESEERLNEAGRHDREMFGIDAVVARRVY